MHGLVLQFNKIYTLGSRYLIFDYKVFIDKFKEIDNKVFRLQYLHNHMYVVKLLQYQNHQFLYLQWMLRRYFGFSNLDVKSSYHAYNL